MKLKSSLALTLIEFLLAMAIFATIAVSVYSTFLTGIQISKKAKNFEGFYRNIRFTIEAIQNDLENMVPYQFKTQDPPVLAFYGDEHSFHLIVPTESGLKKIHYFLSDPTHVHIHKTQLGMHTAKNVAITTGEISNQKQTSVLIRQEQPWGQTPNDEILNKQILNNSWRVSYASWDEDKLIWNNEWIDPAFPIGIQIQMTFVDPSDSDHNIPINKIIYIPFGSLKKIKQ
jgi:type II secretory pathway pseudopilin PulG